MFSSWKQVLLFFWMLISIITGVLIFCSGFLLSRRELGLKSECRLNALSDIKGLYTEHTGCLSERRFPKAIILIIDALRYDFAVYNETRNPATLKAYQNRLPVIHQKLSSKPQNSALFKFIADPPTTTMQRIKGLTTGSLPTFVDAGSNFASHEIQEDNFLYQLNQLGMKVTFMGDDTWTGLYPNAFQKTFPYPSLNVIDLHTVDNGVNTHLLPEMRKDDWNVIIAHYLGVDHCGHTYGPDHPEMTRKLEQMNEVINEVMHFMKDDTVLFVMGDHGMTRTGDHGGESVDELEAALFMYSPAKLVVERKDEGPVVSQVDFVPTFSLLLGLPIPFSNLGSVIPDILYIPQKALPSKNNEFYLCSQIQALNLNSQQVSIYLQKYLKETDEFPPGRYNHFQEVLDDATDLHNNRGRTICSKNAVRTKTTENVMHLEAIVAKYEKYLHGTKDMCKGIWAKFDLVFMFMGITIVLLMVGISVIISQLHVDKLLSGIFSTGVVTFSICYSLLLIVSSILRYKINREVAGALLVYSALIYILICFYDMGIPVFTKLYSGVAKTFHPRVLFPCFLGGCWLFLHFSNSYTVREDHVTLFCCQSYVWFLAISGLVKLQKERKVQDLKPSHRGSKKTFDLGYVLTSPEMLLVLLCLGFSIILRVLIVFKRCREEQHECIETSFLEPLSTFTEADKRYQNVRFFMACAILAIYVYMIKYWMRYNGNLNGTAFLTFCCNYGLPICAFAIAYHWGIQVFPKKITDRWPMWRLTAGPQIVYWTTLIAFAGIILQPLCIYVVDRSGKDLPVIQTNQNVVPQLFHYIKSQLRNNKRASLIKDQVTQSRAPLVYGLGTVYSTTIIVIVALLGLVITLLLGDGMGLSVVLYIAAMFLYLEITAIHETLSHPLQETKRIRPTFGNVLGWCMLMSYMFFTTGHQHTITAVEWGAAYTGFRGDFTFFAIPAMLILLHTFASYILGGLALPLLILWPAMRGKSIFHYTPNAEVAFLDKGEFTLNEDRNAMQNVFKVLVQAFTIFALKTMATMLAAGLHRRHLMVWKIFAPRFIFEALALVVVAVSLTMSSIIITRVYFSLEQWVQRLQLQQQQEHLTSTKTL